MAFLDSTLILSNAQAITTSAASTNVYDVTGAGVGNASNMIFGQDGTGAALLPGADIGAGQGVNAPKAVFTVTTTGTGTGTIAFGIEAAVDSGANTEGTYVRLATSKARVGTTLLAGNTIIIDIPPEMIAQVGELKPRFYRFYYDQTGNGAVSVTGSIQMNPEMGLVGNIYGNNFVAA